MKTCATCRHWDHAEIVRRGHPHRTREAAGGICTSPKFSESWGGDEPYEADALIYPYSEGGEFWTGPEFGCVHHAKA